MRGRVILYSLLLILLVCLTCGVDAISCGSNSIASKTNDACNCDSGYAGASCEIGPSGCTPLIADPKKLDFKPRLANDTGAFTRNTLITSIASQYVYGRQYTAIELQGANNTRCSLGSAGSYWTKHFEGCEDHFQFALPWVNHTSCGFLIDPKNTNDNVLQFTAKMTIYYEDYLDEIMGVLIMRKVSVPFTLYLVLPKYITITLVNVTVVSEVNITVTDIEYPYNPETFEMTLRFMTRANWPNKLLGPVTLIPPPGINVSKSYVDFNEPDCSINTLDSYCNQTLEFTLMITDDTLCEFDGNYTVNAQVITCRNSSACTRANVTIIIELDSDDLCARHYPTPNVNATMMAYDNDRFTPGTNVSGATLDFPIWINTDLFPGEGTTVLGQKFLDIWYDAQIGDGRKYMLRRAEMFEDGVKSQLQTSADGKWFTFTFSKSVFSTDPITNMRDYRLGVALELTLPAQNVTDNSTATTAAPATKRSVHQFYIYWDAQEAYAATTKGEISASMVVTLKGKNSEEVKPDDKSPMSDGQIAGAVIGAAAGAALAAVAAVAAVRRKRRQSRHLEIAAAVAAASAAAFAAAEAASFAEQAERPPTPPPTVSPILDFNRV